MQHAGMQVCEMQIYRYTVMQAAGMQVAGMQVAGIQIFSYIDMLCVGMHVSRNTGMQKQNAGCPIIDTILSRQLLYRCT